MKSADESGGAYALLVIAPVTRGSEAELRTELEALEHPGPLAELPRTHFGRWVMLPSFVTERGQREDPLRHQQLIFSACLDGPLDSYLDELCAKPWAARIWSRCEGVGADLKAYLLRHQVHTGFFVAAYADASVARVRSALDQRDRLSAFALRTQGLAPAELQREFTREFPRVIDLADLQGDILRAYGNDYERTSYVFAAVGDPSAARAWIGRAPVTSGAPWTAGKPETALNLAFTAAGLQALGVPLDGFADEFREGMGARAALLGDPEPAAYEPGLDGAHVLVTLNALDERRHTPALAGLREALAAAGLEVVHETHAALLEGAREHFGFTDGFAQPAVEGVSDGRARGGGVPDAGGSWRPLAAGEFVLGYGDEQTRDDPRKRLPGAPPGALGRSGTYMVWRKLRQDVARWRRMLAAAAPLYAGGDEAKLAAKVVGRWANGTPLVNSPDAPRADWDAAAPEANAFRYLDADADGRRCPLGAHIRRTNPRDALGFDGRLSFRHRIIRRGMPYGPELAPGATEDDGAERGLVFVCFNASLSRQFEAIQTQWVNDGNVFRLSHDGDYLLGPPSRMTVQGAPPFFLGPEGPFVTLRGGGYLYVPGLAGLAQIAAA